MSDFRYGSHLPVMLQAILKYGGPVLELGSGKYSTPFLHWVCFDKQIPLLTVENNRKYYQLNRRLGYLSHKVKFINSWDDLDYSVNWKIALIDHSPARRRIIEIQELVNTEIFVVHDTQPGAEKNYGYYEIFDNYRYRFDYTKLRQHTTVLSNTIDITGIMD